MEWTAVWDKRPEVGKNYLTYSADGRLVIKQYNKLYPIRNCDGLYQKSQYSIGHPYRKEDDPEDYILDFVTIGGWCGRRSKKVLYYMELPPLPERHEDEEVTLREQMYLLQQTIAELEEGKRK